MKTLQPGIEIRTFKRKNVCSFTDGLKGITFRAAGITNVQILEFIDMEHTPKNILIRAVKNSKKNNKDNEKMTKSYMNCRNFINGELTLEKLISGGMK